VEREKNSGKKSREREREKKTFGPQMNLEGK